VSHVYLHLDDTGKLILDTGLIATYHVRIYDRGIEFCVEHAEKINMK